MNEIKKCEAIEKVLQTFVTAVGKRTSQRFIYETTSNILKNLQPTYPSLKYVTIEKTSSGQICKVNVEDNLFMGNIDKKTLNECLDEIIRVLFQTIIQDEIHYSTSLQEIVEEITNDCRKILETLGLTIRFREAIKGSAGAGKGKVSGTVDITHTKNSDVMKPIANALMYLLDHGMLKKEKSETNETMILSIRDLEKKHKIFKYMILEDTGKKDGERFDLKTEFTVKEVLFLDSRDSYAVDAVSKIDEVPTDELAAAIRDFVLEIGRFINLEERPDFIRKFRKLISEECKLKLKEMGLDLDEIDEILTKEGYYLLIRETIRALIEIMGNRTSTKFAVTIIDIILVSLQEKHGEVLKHIKINKSLYEKGIGAVSVEYEINKEDPYEIAKTIHDILKFVQEKQQNHQDKANFIKDFEREVGRRHIAELEKIGVNPYIISMRYV